MNKSARQLFVSRVLAKSYVGGYTKEDGTYVKPHVRKGDKAAPKAASKPIKFYSKPPQTGAAPSVAAPKPAAKPKPKPEPVVAKNPHPRAGEKGEVVDIKTPHTASPEHTWHDPKATATFVPDGNLPESLNGIPLRTWKDAPKTEEGWDYVDGQMDDLVEPPFTLPVGKKAAAGVVIEEPDGRVWLIAPTNAFGGYTASFPKGTAEPGLSLQANAIKEAFEESGLKIQITGFLGDAERTTSKARFYTAKRVGGDPTAMGWESQAVHLVPKSEMYDHLNMWPDHAIAELAGAGPAPEKPAPKPKHGHTGEGWTSKKAPPYKQSSLKFYGGGGKKAGGAA